MAALMAMPAAAQGAAVKREPVVDAMLKLAGVTKTDVVYDLGSGDGSLLVAAALDYGARGVGVDINPERVREGVDNARKAGVENLVTFEENDMFEADIRNATVVALYRLPDMNKRLRPKLLRDLKPGTRVVSRDFDMGEEWKPERTVTLDGTTLYLWRVPERR